MAFGRYTNFPNGITSFGEPVIGAPITSAGKKYFVSRNRSASGDGSSWDECFKTIGEAIAAVNAGYTAAVQPDIGRNTVIYIGEGWYSETPLTLTASDCWIECVAPGFHDSTVLYGSATAGGFDITSGGPALTITGSNNTIRGLGVFTHDVLYPAMRNGANASDPDGPTASGPTGNAFINCSSVRDVADGCDGGILDYGADGTLIEGCFFSTSNATYGVKIATNGVINPVNPVVRHSRFVGTETGILMSQGHNGAFLHNHFHDDTSDRPDTVDTPIVINGTGYAFGNVSPNTNRADLVTGTGTLVDLWNHGSDTVNT